MTDRPAIPSPPHSGRCLCGRVRYRLDGRPLAVNACHCADCRKLTGATNLLMILAHSDRFVHEGGDVERYRKRADSGREIDLVRCAHCGVRLWHEPLASPEFVFIAAGTLDNTGWAIPTSHIWTKGASPGAIFQDDAACWDGQPETRQQLLEAFARVYGG